MLLAQLDKLAWARLAHIANSCSDGGRLRRPSPRRSFLAPRRPGNEGEGWERTIGTRKGELTSLGITSGWRGVWC